MLLSLIKQLGQKSLFYIVITALLALGGCATTTMTNHYPSGKDGAPNFKIDASKVPDAVPKPEPPSKYGNPPSYVVDGHRYYVLKSAEGYDEKGIASWYGTKFYKQRTSSGEPYDLAAMTAASKVLPLPTYCQVTNLENGKKVIVKVNDRGPFHVDRIIDLSYVAAVKLGVFPCGTALVEVKAIDPYHPEEVITPTPVSTGPAACAAATPQPLGHAPQIFLQLGAFSKEPNAENLAQKVRQVTTLPVEINQGISANNLQVYRVQIGPVPNVDNSDALHLALKNAGLGEPITVIQ